MSDTFKRALVDAACAVALSSLALAAFHGTYVGWSYLAIGVAGVVFGAAIAALVLRLRQPVVLGAALLVGWFFLSGGAISLHGLGSSYLVPSSSTLSTLAHTVVHGWKELLTTLPPVAGYELLVLPYLLGLVSGFAGLVVARKVAWAPAPVLVLVATMAGVILIGVRDPRDASAVAAAFGLIAIAWIILRSRRSRAWVEPAGKRRVRRQIYAAGLCLACVALGLVAGPALPGLRAHRVVLRSDVAQPFNVGAYPSPLAGFRRFTHGYKSVAAADELNDVPLFKITGAPAGTRVRIATLDSYDGVVWGAANVAGSTTTVTPGNTFQKVGSDIDNPVHGTPVRGRITVLSDALGVWLPAPGALTGISFDRPHEVTGSRAFRYNLASSTGVYPAGLAQGDAYSYSAVLPDDSLSDVSLGGGSLQSLAGLTDVQPTAAAWAGSDGSGLAQVQHVAAFLKQHGHYTDGERGNEVFTAGHSLKRVKEFIDPEGQYAGDDEQYAAVMALMANSLGVPARVVFGAVVPNATDGVVKGKDVHAWIELQADDGSWRTMPQDDFMNFDPPTQQNQTTQPSVPASMIPPPAPVHPPGTVGEPLDDGINHRAQNVKKPKKHDDSPFFDLPPVVDNILKWVGIPVLCVLAWLLVASAFKRGRRYRRRRGGSRVMRLAAAWREVLDHVHDLGHRPPARATRREQAAALGLAGLADSARDLDAAMFAGDEPSEELVQACWARGDQLRKDISRTHGWFDRLKAAGSPGTFTHRRVRTG